MAELAINQLKPHLTFAELEKRLLAGERNFTNLNLDGLALNEIAGNYFGIDFSGSSLVRAKCSGKSFTKVSFANADLTGVDFTHTVFFDTDLNEAIIHGAAFYGAVANEYGSETNLIEQVLARCVVSSSARSPRIHFSSVDQDIKHWILLVHADPDETFRALMEEYLSKHSILGAFFSQEGRYRAVVALYMQTHPNGSFANFLEYLNTDKK